MLNIEERKSSKVVGNTSLFLSFDYNQQYVDIMRKCSGANFSQKTKEWEIPLTYLSLLLDSLCIYDDITLKLLKDSSAKKLKKVQLHKHKTKLFDYQEEGVKYGLQHDKFLLLDDPGLGKSLQIITLAEELKETEGLEHCLIICGINTLKENWRKEIEKHSNLSCKILGEVVSKKGKRSIGGVKERLDQLKKPIEEFFVITNIESLRSDDIVKEILKNKNHFDMMVLDECHKAKNPESRQGKNFLKLNKANHKVAATGTLLLNNPLDAYVPLKWIGAENATYTNFKYYYCTYGGEFNSILIGFKNIDILKEEIDSNSIRRTKDILNLPPKTIIDEIIEMEPDQQTFYENVKNGVKEVVDKVELKATNTLALVSRLRQASTCPSVLTTENISSAKIERCCDLVEEIVGSGHKVVIFSNFKEPVYQLEERLKQYNPLISTGDIKDSIVSENIDKFQNDESYKVFIGTISKCGTGITLTAADYEIFIDLPWTDALYTQAQDRCYRIGTKNNVTIYHLMCKDTVDEKVLSIVNDKKLISDYVVDDKVSPNMLNRLKELLTDL